VVWSEDGVERAGLGKTNGQQGGRQRCNKAKRSERRKKKNQQTHERMMKSYVSIGEEFIKAIYERGGVCQRGDEEECRPTEQRGGIKGSNVEVQGGEMKQSRQEENQSYKQSG
jgi:hypothetical protein